jgi:hypothetical protein
MNMEIWAYGRFAVGSIDWLGLYPQQFGDLVLSSA